MTVSMVFGLVLFSGCASIKGETTTEYIVDSTMTTKVDARNVKDLDAHYSKNDVTKTQGPGCSLVQDRCDDNTK